MTLATLLADGGIYISGGVLLLIVILIIAWAILRR
jgi:hypothetical protein